MTSSRRDFLAHGCAAVLLATAGLPGEAAAAGLMAPRLRCPHTGCRHHRPSGTCGFALLGAPVLLPDEPLPTEAAVLLPDPLPELP